MARLSIDQLVALAQNAGFEGQDAAIAAAIAMAESAGNPQAYNPERQAGAAQGAGSYGLWQIYLTAHPQFDASQLVTDPAYNASAAYQVYASAGYSFTPWSTYKYGQYQNYLAEANAAAGTDGSAVDSSGNGGTSASDSLPLIAIAGAALLLGVIWYFKG